MPVFPEIQRTPTDPFLRELHESGRKWVIPDLRITWLPKGRGWPRPSTIQVRVVPKGDKTTVVFHEEHLPGPDEREERRAFFKGALDELERIILAD